MAKDIQGKFIMLILTGFGVVTILDYIFDFLSVPALGIFYLVLLFVALLFLGRLLLGARARERMSGKDFAITFFALAIIVAIFAFLSKGGVAIPLSIQNAMVAFPGL